MCIDRMCFHRLNSSALTSVLPLFYILFLSSSILILCIHYVPALFASCSYYVSISILLFSVFNFIIEVIFPVFFFWDLRKLIISLRCYYRRVPHRKCFSLALQPFFLHMKSRKFRPIQITEISFPKFSTEKTICLNSIIHGDLMQYSDSAQFSKVLGLFQISYHYFCIEIFSSQGTEMSKLLHTMVDNRLTASLENSTII